MTQLTIEHLSPEFQEIFRQIPGEKRVLVGAHKGKRSISVVLLKGSVKIAESKTNDPSLSQFEAWYQGSRDMVPTLKEWIEKQKQSTN